MSNLSDAMELETLKWLLTTDSVTRPPARYMALFTSDPTDAGTGNEVSATGYVRQPIAMDVFVDGADTVAENADQIEFPPAPEGSGGWGTITHGAVFDAETGGRLLVHGLLAEAKTIATYDIFRLNAGDWRVRID